MSSDKKRDVLPGVEGHLLMIENLFFFGGHITFDPANLDGKNARKQDIYSNRGGCTHANGSDIDRRNDIEQYRTL
jgi:hypothetical protein